MELDTCPDGAHEPKIRRHPSSEADSSLWVCAKCSTYVCLACGITEVDGPCLFCDSCDRRELELEQPFDAAADEAAEQDAD